MDKALIITLSNIGDLVMSTPLMEGISTLMPEKSIDVLGDARSSELLKNAPYVSTIFNRDKKGKLGQQVNLFNRLGSQRYDLIVDLRTGFLPYLLHSQHKYIKRKGSGSSSIPLKNVTPVFKATVSFQKIYPIVKFTFPMMISQEFKSLPSIYRLASG